MRIKALAKRREAGSPHHVDKRVDVMSSHREITPLQPKIEASRLAFTRINPS